MRKGVLPVTAGLCVLAVTVMMIALLSGGRQESFSPPPFDAAAQTGAPEVPENAGYGEMDAKAFRFSAAGELEVQDGKTDVWLTNPAGNTVWLKVRILDENGDILGESGLIRPGERAVGELNSVPQQTTARMKIMAYEPETYYSASSAVLNTTLKIA
ncbi:MAG: hypothetical protein ACLTXL_17070 [Clostridia bacterium]